MEKKEINNVFDSKDYKRSRSVYMVQCTFDYFITILVADAFLAKLLSYIGISDAMIGVISSIITLAFLFQLLAIFVARKLVNVKRTVVIADTVSQLLFLSLYLIPFTPFSTSVKTVMVVAAVFVAYIAKYLVASILFKWANSYVDPTKRAGYSAVKEMISLFAGIVFTLTVGAVIDRYEALGNPAGAFLFISVTMLILIICNVISLLAIKNQTQEVQKETIPFRTILKNTLGNRNFVNVIIMTALWDVARYMSMGFLGTFKTKDLLLSVGTVQVINMIANLGRMAVSLPFGQYSDKHSYASGIKLAFLIAAAGFAVNIFTTNNTWWLIIIFTVLYNISLAGSNQNSFNISYSYVPAKYFVPAMAIKNSIGGICGFGASLLGSRILAYVQENGNMVLGIPMYGQQLLSGISFVILVITVVFIHVVVEKQTVTVQ